LTSLAAGGFDYPIPSKKMMHSCDRLGDFPEMFDFKISGLPPPVEVKGSQREYFTSLAAGRFDYPIPSKKMIAPGTRAPQLFKSKFQ